MPKDSPVRVLVAEDNKVVSLMIQKSLAKLGHELAGVAESGREAVRMALRLEPDVILMDIEMPELNGLDATWEIQHRQPVPVVVLTAFEDGELIEKAGKVGVSAYLIKPPRTKEIERAIIMAMARHDDLMECWRLNRELENALAEIKTLRGILPLCSFCNRIRDAKGDWQKVDVYICRNSEAAVSHSICPDCTKIHYPEE